MRSAQPQRVRCAIYTRKSCEEHVAVTRHIFDRYLALGSVRLLADELIRTRTLSPARSTTTGKRIGGCAFSRGQLYPMLKCVTYTGQIGHHGKLYEGRHPAIIDLDMFARAQAMLADHTRGTRTCRGRASTSLLAGKIVDGDGNPLIATHATRTVASHGGEGKARYRYYVSRDLHHGTAEIGMRIPAREIERLVTDRTASCSEILCSFPQPHRWRSRRFSWGELHRRCGRAGPCEARGQRLLPRSGSRRTRWC